METSLLPSVTLSENVTLETKYRDIADGNRMAGQRISNVGISLETKYRDIADGNGTSTDTTADSASLETKYRDIADGVTKQIIRQARCRTWRI